LFIYFLGDDRLQPLAANSLGSGKDIPGSIRNNIILFFYLQSSHSMNDVIFY